MKAIPAILVEMRITLNPLAAGTDKPNPVNAAT
jgi:hypothetical protein